MDTLILLFLSADHAIDDRSLYQKTLLELMFRNTRTFDIPFHDVNSIWRIPGNIREIREFHLNFVDGKLKLVDFCLQNTLENVNYEYVTSTVESLSIRRCNQKQTLLTRALPREARVVNFGYNSLFGTLDLQTLPLDLVRLDLRHNHFNGRVSLFHLPTKIKIINLSHNRLLGDKHLYYGNLPESIQKIYIGVTNIATVSAVSNEFENPNVFSLILELQNHS